MSVFSSTWADGKIDDINKLIFENHDRNFMFILDTNFAIMARYYVTDIEYFNLQYEKQKSDFENSIKVIKKNRSVIIYAMACEEASRVKYTGNIDLQKYKLMVKCIGAIFDMNFRDDILSKNELVIDDMRKSKIPILLKNGLFRKQNVITYTLILKAYLLKHFDDRDSKTIINDVFKFMAHEMNNFSSVGTSFIIHYLGNEPNILKKTNPSQGADKILAKLYAASIDMLMPTQASQLSEVSGYAATPIFVTFDKGIKLLFDSLVVVGEHQLTSNIYIPKYSFKIFYSSGWKDEDIMEICQTAQQVQREERKKINDKEKELLRLNELALKLELELLTKLKN